jgi:hypothetical protein
MGRAKRGPSTARAARRVRSRRSAAGWDREPVIRGGLERNNHDVHSRTRRQSDGTIRTGDPAHRPGLCLDRPRLEQTERRCRQRSRLLRGHARDTGARSHGLGGDDRRARRGYLARHRVPDPDRGNLDRPRHARRHPVRILAQGRSLDCRKWPADLLGERGGLRRRGSLHCLGRTGRLVSR